MKRFTLIVTFLFLTIFLFACGTGTGVENNQGAQDEPEEVLVEETKKDLKFEVQINQNTFQLDDEIIVKASATNIGNSEITYVSGSSSCPTYLSIRVVSQETGNHLMRKPPEEIKACTDDINISELAVNDWIEEKAIFLPKEFLDTSKIPAYGGVYDVIVSIQLADGSWSEENEEVIEVKTEITIERPNQEMLDKESAEEIARKRQDVKQWISDHTGERIAKVENGEYYILWFDGWEKTEKDQYDKLKEGIYQDEKQVRFSDGKWSVEYLSKLGSPPHRIKVIIDAYDGEILSVETFEK